jgi:hypothetical protein
MNIKRERRNIRKSRLENEVILAVVILYVLLSAALLALHHIQPTETETRTSLTSPSHEALHGGKPSDAKAQSGPAKLSLVETRALLTRQGYQEIRGLRRDGVRYRATAIKGGKAWEVEVDPVSHAIAAERVPDVH